MLSMLWPAPWWASSFAPVASIIARLPPVWSSCSWVLRIWVIAHPSSLATARHFSWSSGSMASATPLSGQAIT